VFASFSDSVLLQYLRATTFDILCLYPPKHIFLCLTFQYDALHPCPTEDVG